jgi:hypothetical protein
VRAACCLIDLHSTLTSMPSILTHRAHARCAEFRCAVHRWRPTSTRLRRGETHGSASIVIVVGSGLLVDLAHGTPLPVD